MAGYNFKKEPQKVPLVETKHRSIKTKIPAPESIPLFRELESYESRSMHGQLPVLWDKAEGFTVSDKYGNRWIDFTSTIFVTNAGHANPAIAKAIISQAENKMLHSYTFVQEIRIKFLKKLIDMLPKQFEKAFLLSAGTEATECAVKLIRMHGRTIKPKKLTVISFRGSMHGRTMGAEMLKGDPDSSSWIGYRDPNMLQLPFPFSWTVNDKDHDWRGHFRQDMEGLRKKGLDFSNIAGFIIESYLGWGAIFFPPEYIQELSVFAKEHDSLVAFDEIQGGFGRSGKLFSYQHYSVEPDMLCLGKALSGSLPLSAVVGSKKIMDLPEVGSMSSTHSANPLCCAAALANLGAIESLGLISEAARKGDILHRRLDKIKERFSGRIVRICGKGLLAGIIIADPSTGKPDSVFASMVCERAMQKGLLLVHTGRESIKIGPPLTISDEALDEGLGTLEESIAEIGNEARR